MDLFKNSNDGFSKCSYSTYSRINGITCSASSCVLAQLRPSFGSLVLTVLLSQTLWPV